EFFPSIQTHLAEHTGTDNLVNVFTETILGSPAYIFVPREALEDAGITDFYTSTTTVEALCEATGTESAELGPSPTGRGECVPHGDHWDCEEGTGAGHDDDDDEDDDEHGGEAGPSPTESVGC